MLRLSYFVTVSVRRSRFVMVEMRGDCIAAESGLESDMYKSGRSAAW